MTNHFESQENLIEKIRLEFKRMKEENKGKKGAGEKYDPHFDNLLPELIGKDEAQLWNDFESAESEEGVNNLANKFEDYRNKISEQFLAGMAQKGREATVEEIMTDPKQAFVGFIGNQITKKQLEIYRKKLRK